MKWRDAVILAGSNLKQTPLRTFLTTLGVVVGIASLICMFAFGLGMQKIGVDQASKYNPLNSITVFPQPVRFHNLDNEERKKSAIPLDETTIEKIKKIPGVKSIVPVVQFPVEIKTKNGPLTVLGRSFDSSSPRDKQLYKIEGKAAFSSNTAMEAIIHEDVLKLIKEEKKTDHPKEIEISFFSPELSSGGGFMGMAPMSLGKKTEKLKIVGIIRKGEGVFENPMVRSEVLAPLGTVVALGLHKIAVMESMMRNPASKNLYTMIEVEVDDPMKISQIEESIKTIGLRTVSFYSIMKEMNQVFFIINSILGAIGSIALFVAALGIINTMIIAVLERRKDIGIMKSVGATRWSIKQLFFMEAFVIGLSGGAFGCAVGWGVAKIVNSVLVYFIRRQGGTSVDMFYFPVWLIISCILFAIVVSLSAALYPSSRAARLDPVEALRYE